MTKSKITTIVGAIVAVAGLVVPKFGFEITDSDAGQLTSAIVTLVGILMTIFGPSVKPPKGSGNALLVALCGLVLAGGMLGPLTGCQALQDNPTVTKAVFRIGLRAATYAVVRNNPDLQPYLAGIGGVFATPEAALAPEQVRDLIDGSLDDLEGISEQDRLLIESVTDEAVAIYADIYEANVGKLSDLEYRSILEAMGQAIIAGAVPSVDGPAGGVFVMDTPGGFVQIE